MRNRRRDRSTVSNQRNECYETLPRFLKATRCFASESGEGIIVPESELLNAIYFSPDQAFALAVAAKLGFQLFPEYAIPAESVSSILSWADSARKDKPCAKSDRKENVVLGVMSREEFLRRYGG